MEVTPSDISADIPTKTSADVAEVVLLNKAIISYAHDELTEGFDPWDQYSVSLGRKFSFGSVIARVNQARRFNTNGTQVEVDAYPRIRDGTYLYLNAGRSSDSIFPSQRYGFEIFQNLGNAWEASLGNRYLEFDQSIVRIYTGTVGKYIGNYYYLFRANFVPDEAGDSYSGRMQIRRYYGNENYVSISASAGDSPTLVTAGNIAVLKSSGGSLDLYHSLTATVFGSLGLSYSKDEIRAGTYRGDWTYSGSIEKRF